MIHTIHIFGLEITEPTTMVTDYMITAVAWWFGAKLIRRAYGDRTLRLWSLGFLFVGAGAFLGGTSHGFVQYLDDLQMFGLWKATIYSVGLSMLFAVSGTIEGARMKNPHRTLLHGVNIIGFAVYAVWMIDHSQFIYVIYHYVTAMIAIALIQVWAHFDHRAASSPWLIGGVVVTLLGAVIQQSGITIHRHFNHNDLYHVIQIGGLVLLYRGVLLFRVQRHRHQTAGERS